MTAGSFRERCCCNMYGICTSTTRPTSATCRPGASAERSTVSRPTRSFIPFAASGFVSVLLAKTLRSSTFKLALIWIGIFGALVLALLGYVYWSTATYVRERADRAIAAEQMILRDVYDSAGRDGLIAAIKDRVAPDRFESGVYLLADPSFGPVAGNLKAWPAALKESRRWYDVGAREWKPDAADHSVLRATFETLPDGYHLLVGRNADDLDAFTRKIEVALLLGVSLIFVLAGVASV